MRYGHLIGGVLLLIFLVFLGILLVSPPKPNSKKIGVGNNNAQQASVVSSSSAGEYYKDPQTSSFTKVLYTDSGFSPASVVVPIGGTVAFENRSSDPFWPASDPDPGHSRYPGLGLCGGVFDPCAPVPAGVAWTFRFDKAGEWGYHNHLKPAHKGIILVK